MTFRIETGPDGADVIITDSPDMARAGPSRVKSQALPANHAYMRLSDGQMFTNAKPMYRLSPAEAEMVEHYLREKGADIGPDIFAGPSRG